MPRSVEHLVAVHALATQRRRQRKPVWAHQLDLSGVFHDDALTFEQRRDAIVAIIKASRWYRRADRNQLDGVVDIVDDHLAYAETADEFDDRWDELYDLAGYERVWIKTR